MFDETQYRISFNRLTQRDPFAYQVRVARLLVDHKNVLLRAPTGAGKTWAVIVPFLANVWDHKPNRLIYALPLRTLAQGVYQQARWAAGQLGLPTTRVLDETGREESPPFVTLQTGEQPDDPFFNRGRIIVTTYDQVLSGLLENPYGLSMGLHNINAAAVAGALVVFDEFHLMPPDKAFLTAAAGMHLFRDLCQSVWMTATATEALQQVLRDALAAESVPNNQAEWQTLLQSLPSVTKVRRDIVMKQHPLTPTTVLDHHENRSIVLFNQVRRAQDFFEILRKEISARRLSVEVILLHSRFFRGDRQDKESKLRALFARGVRADAILVATQVVEAGVDISCEHLHTEICPANSLIERAGRCARFEGENGLVHVYPLPQDSRAWLPYGDENRESETLSATRALLENCGLTTLNPTVVDEWVQMVHQAEDSLALRQGWPSRLIECLRCIESIAVNRQQGGVARFIRGDNDDQVRLLISQESSLPQTPGRREGLSVRRTAIFRLLKGSEQPAGWFWDTTEEEPRWKPLTCPHDITGTYVICLKPAVAAYSHEIGLRIGEAGTVQSPDRAEPPRPGALPLRREPWKAHALRVAAEAQRRLEREDLIGVGLLRWGLELRYGLDASAVEQAVRACGLLHDLGKLQTGWQTWAEAYQRAKDPCYQHNVPLAHTDFDPKSAEDWAVQRSLSLHRPPHSAASAYYGAAFLARLLDQAPAGDRACIASACASAILGHHGGWWSTVGELIPAVGEELSKTVGPCLTSLEWSKLVQHTDKKGPMDRLLSLTTSGENLRRWWPLVAYLTRTLRLSDQRATSEAAVNE